MQNNRPRSSNAHIPRTTEMNPTAPTAEPKPDHHPSIPEERVAKDLRLDRRPTRHYATERRTNPGTTGRHPGYQNRSRERLRQGVKDRHDTRCNARTRYIADDAQEGPR